MNMKENPSET